MAYFKQGLTLTSGVFDPARAKWLALKERFTGGTDQRKLTRYRVAIEAELVSGRLSHLNGRVKDMSIGGCLFRPASFYLVDRAGEEVTVAFGEITLHGKIVRTLPIGYAVQFKTRLSDALFEKVLTFSKDEASLFDKSLEDETKATAKKAKA
ncbi:MAG: PilZ domain-containing protein [Pseudomonadota bacterium]